MKIAITGHTRGIGQAIAASLAEKGHEIAGFSRGTGHDLADRGQRDLSLAEIKSCDVFVDNAFLEPRQAQRPVSWVSVELLYEIHRAWRGRADKTIVVIGSAVQNHPLTQDHPYQIHKIAVNLACRQLRAVSDHPRIIQINPGATDTDQIRHKAWIKMDAVEVARVVEFCINSLDHIYVNEITFTPGRLYHQP